MIPVELLYGVLVSMVNIMLHCLVIVILVRFILSLARPQAAGRPKRQRTLRLACLMMMSGAILTFSHMFQVWIWAFSYWLVGALPEKDAYYFAFESFTTVGYGDLVPVERWRVLGPVTAANGMLLFGASTALVFAILTRAASALDVLHPLPHRRTPRRASANATPTEAPPPRRESDPTGLNQPDR